MSAVLHVLLEQDSATDALRAVDERVGGDPELTVALGAAVDEVRSRMRVTDEVLAATLADDGGAPLEAVVAVLGLSRDEVECALDDYAQAVAELHGEPPATSAAGTGGSPRLVFVDDALQAAPQALADEELAPDRDGPGSLIWVAGVLVLLAIVALAFVTTSRDDSAPVTVREVRVVTEVDPTGRPGAARAEVDADDPVRAVVVLEGDVADGAPMLELLLLREGQPVHRSELPVSPASPTLTVSLPAATIGMRGDYEVVVFADGTPVASAAFEVTA